MKPQVETLFLGEILYFSLLSREREYIVLRRRRRRRINIINERTKTVLLEKTNQRFNARFSSSSDSVEDFVVATIQTTTKKKKTQMKSSISQPTNSKRKSKNATSSFFTRHSNVYLYVPNIIGYARLLLVFVSFYYSSSGGRTNTKNHAGFISVFTYLLSFICDELDGRFARKCNQCTEFGAVLDMVTDRLATTGLLIILSNIYSEMQFVCISLIFLDISSHWLQMHSQLAIGKRGHKDMRESRFRLLRLYYANRIFMGVCCVSTEVLYLCLFMAKDKELNAIPGLVPISKEIIKRVSFIETFDSFLQKTLGVGSLRTFATQFIVLAIPGFLLKQIANIAQLRSAVVAMCEHEPEFAAKREEAGKKN